jgi:hypothetical protein
MFWADIRALPKVELNCALVKEMLCEVFEERYTETEPTDKYVQELTLKLESYLALQLNRGESMCLSQAFLDNT